MCFRIVAPSLVMTTSPVLVWICDMSAYVLGEALPSDI